MVCKTIKPDQLPLSSFDTHRCKSVRDEVNGHILSQGRVHWPNLLGDEPRAVGTETLVVEVQAEAKPFRLCQHKTLLDGALEGSNLAS